MVKNIVLTGFMGTGKSAIGKRLARLLKRSFYDTDQEVEEVTGLTISQIFAKHGELRFRSEEKLVIRKLAAKENAIIATGGGAVLDDENIKELSENGVLICLTADPEVILARVSKKNTRPLIKKDYGLEEIKEMLEERDPYYKKADLFIDTSKNGFDEVISKIVSLLKERGAI